MKEARFRKDPDKRRSRQTNSEAEGMTAHMEIELSWVVRERKHAGEISRP